MTAMVLATAYGLPALSFAALLVLLLFGRRRSDRGALLIVACIASLLWAMSYAAGPFLRLPRLAEVQGVGELIRYATWFAVLRTLLMARGSEVEVTEQSKGAGALWNRWTGVAFFGAGCVALALVGRVFLPAHQGELFVAGLLAASIVGLLFVEQIYRGVSPRDRWGIKHAVIGLGLVFIYDFYTMADALLSGGVDETLWLGRGVVNAALPPLLAVSIARNPTWRIDIAVSRQVVVNSVVVSGAGIYLLVMAAAGYYLRLIGAAWGPLFQVLFLVGAIVLLAVGLVSGSFWSWLRVSISKHFFSFKYDYRAEWLRLINTLAAESGGETLRTRCIRALGEIMDSPGGLLWSVNEHGNFLISATWNTRFPGVVTEAGGSALIEFLRTTGWVLELDDVRAHPEHYGGLELLPSVARVKHGWLLIPLIRDDYLQGFVVLTRPKVARELNWEDRDLLKTAGAQVAGYLALVDASEALMDTRQLDAFNRISAFVVHDLKNIQAQLALVSANAARHRDNPEFVADAFATVGNATRKLERVLAGLSNSEAEHGSARSVAVDDLLQEVAEGCAAREPRPVLTIAERPLYCTVPREGFVKVLEHLVKNAQEATGESGAVTLAARRADRWCVIEIADNGVGMEEQFLRERFFRALQTTKGNAGMGVGVYEARAFVESAGGLMNVMTEPSKGTTVSIRLPLAEEPAASDATITAFEKTRDAR